MFKKGFTELASPYVSIVEEQQTKTMQVELDESKIETLLIPLLHEKYYARYLQNNHQERKPLQAKWGMVQLKGKFYF